MSTVLSKSIQYSLQFFLAVLFTSLVACDCIQDASGIVLDSETKTPIDGAYVQKANHSHDYCYTDSSGHFNVRSISGGFRKCPAMTITVTKKDYEIKVLKIENEAQDTIYLERIK